MSPQSIRISVAQIQKASLFFDSAQGVYASEIDVVGENHEITRLIVRVNSTSRICQHQISHTTSCQNPDRKSYDAHLITLVEMGPPRANERPHAAQLTVNQRS